MFKMSVFQSVLERLKAEEPATEPDDGAQDAVRGLNTGFVANISAAAAAERATVARAYFETASDEMLAPPKPLPQPPSKPAMPDHLKRVRPDEIARDLALEDDETATGLADRRRHFATDNHPDRHHPEFRANADIRMKIANMLIDEALRRLKPENVKASRRRS